MCCLLTALCGAQASGHPASPPHVCGFLHFVPQVSESRVRGAARGRCSVSSGVGSTGDAAHSVKLPLGGPPAAEGEHAEQFDAACDEEDRVEVAPVGLEQHAGAVLRARPCGFERARAQTPTVAPRQPLTWI